jgi:hypothetical protein
MSSNPNSSGPRPSYRLPAARAGGRGLTCDTSVAAHRPVLCPSELSPASDSSVDPSEVTVLNPTARAQSVPLPATIDPGRVLNSWGILPESAVSTRSYLSTPLSSRCSSPESFAADVPRKPMELTFGIELEHLYAIREDHDPDIRWLNRSSESFEQQREILRHHGLDCTVRKSKFVPEKWNLSWVWIISLDICQNKPVLTFLPLHRTHPLTLPRDSTGKPGYQSICPTRQSCLAGPRNSRSQRVAMN